MDLASIDTNFTHPSTSTSNFDNPEPYFVSPIPPPSQPDSSAHPPPPASSAHPAALLLDRHSSDVGQFSTQGITSVDETPNPNREMDIEAPAIHTQNEEEEDVRGCLLGVKRKTLQEMHDLYKTHGRELGFSVRKSTSRKTDNGVVYSQIFVCSCEGFRQTQGSKRKHPITRTGCGAAMRAELNDDEGCFVVSRHDTAHNHELTRTEWGDRHRSERRISVEKGKVIEEMIESGMRATDSYRYMSHEAGGDESIGHTTKDHLNFVNHLRMKEIEGGDAQKLVEILQQQQDDDEDFFFRVQLDETARLRNVFWRDSMMKEDFNLFGDVVIFDTTYRTNRYNLICAPIVGVNHHRRIVMLGCAFLSDEKTESFEWLFEVFKKSMGGKCPVTIFTDQDQAIANAIKKVFPWAKHRLCQWHLYKNAIARFGQLKSNLAFKEAFKKCMSGCVDLLEFESCWANMVSTYGLEGRSWFDRLYELREKWCTALNKDFFSAGMLSSQRSESTNNVIVLSAKPNTSLTSFYRIFQNLVGNWRKKEADDEFQSSRSTPPSVLPLTGMLKHASEVYTLRVFEEFEAEYIEMLATSCNKTDDDGVIATFDVSSYDADARVVFKVLYCAASDLVSCSCKNFEERGVLCCHCLRVLYHNNRTKIPQLSIQPRWTKFAKSGCWDRLKDRVLAKGEDESGVRIDTIPWRHDMSRKYYNLVLECQGNKEARKTLEECYIRDSLAISALKNFQQPNESSHVSSSSATTTTTMCLDPARSITKGRIKRKQGGLEKSIKKKKKKDDIVPRNNQAHEFGSKTPNPQLL